MLNHSQVWRRQFACFTASLCAAMQPVLVHAQEPVLPMRLPAENAAPPPAAASPASSGAVTPAISTDPAAAAPVTRPPTSPVLAANLRGKPSLPGGLSRRHKEFCAITSPLPHNVQITRVFAGSSLEGQRAVLRVSCQATQTPLCASHHSPTLSASRYFNGDTGEGIGASHQTGWTALVASLIGEPQDSTAVGAGKARRASQSV